VLFCQTFYQERIANRLRKGNVNDATRMHMPDFRLSETEFQASKAVRVNRYVSSSTDFYLLEVIHNALRSNTVWMRESVGGRESTGTAVAVSTCRRKRTMTIRCSRLLSDVAFRVGRLLAALVIRAQTPPTHRQVSGEGIHLPGDEVLFSDVQFQA
jgi:hypothetical protein